MAGGEGVSSALPIRRLRQAAVAARSGVAMPDTFQLGDGPSSAIAKIISLALCIGHYL